METAGNNRFNLLFMDDDGEASAPPAAAAPTPVVAPKKKTPGNAPASTAPKKAQNTAKKPNSASEKENKSGALNKEQAVNKKVPPAQQKPKNLLSRKNNVGENDLREQRSNRRNFRDNNEGTGESNNDRQQRPYKDRENRPPRREGFYRGKREFDRQSGSDKTGVKAVDKRDGAGAHNWGSVKQEIEDINIAADAETTVPEKDDSANEQLGEPVAVPEEEEVKELTLDEWKAMTQREKPKFNIRKPGEGEDTTQWKKMIVLNKKKEEDSEEELEYDPSMYPQRVGRLQRIVDIQFNFNDGRRKGGNFGGRGRGGPGSRRSGDGEKTGRFEGRNNAPSGNNFGRNNSNKSRNFGDRQKSGPNNLKVDYENQFPTLS